MKSENTNTEAVNYDIGVYTITNKIDGRFYIGQTAVSLAKRKNAHFSGHNSNVRLQRAMRKYGKHNFEFSVVMYCAPNQEVIDWLESSMIQSFMKQGKLYNFCLSGSSALGLKRSKATKKKMSLAQKGRTFSKETIQKMSDAAKGNQRQLGLKRTEETRKKLSDSHKGLEQSIECRQKQSEARIGIFGKPVVGTHVVTGEEIIFDSSMSAGFVLSGKPRANVTAAITGRRDTAYGYTWAYV